MDKANEYRFSITLNPNDPLHKIAISTLNAQGRRKAQFIVNAVTVYISNNIEHTTSSQLDRTYIEEICRDTIRDYLKQEERKEVLKLNNVSNKQYSNDIDSDVNDECNDDINMIADTIESFRKKI